MTKCKHGIECDLPCALCDKLPSRLEQVALPVMVIGCVIFWIWMLHLLNVAITKAGAL